MNMNIETRKRMFVSKVNELYDKFKKDCKRINELTKPKEILKELEKCKWDYDKEWRELESNWHRYKLQGIIECGTTRFNDFREKEFIKIKKKHNLLPKKERQTYQNSNKGENSHQITQEEVVEQNEENTYNCAECFQDKTGSYLSCKEKNDGKKLCSKKCFQECYGEICKKQPENTEQEWNPTIYCRYCSAKSELFDVCDKQECLAKMNQEIEDKKGMDNDNKSNDDTTISIERERERESNLTQQQQLQSEITTLEQNLTNPENQAELEVKKKELQELQTKEKTLRKSLPLDTQISILEGEIRELEGKSDKTQAEETLSAEKKSELEKLLEEKNKSSSSNSESKDKTAFCWGVGIGGVLVIFLIVVILARNRKRKK